MVSSLFPQLAGRSRNVYRAAFAFIVVALAAVAVAGLNAPVIAISAIAVPLLFLIYVWEIDPLEVRFAVPTAVIFVVGAGLGVGWGLLLGPVVSNSLVPRLATSLTTGGVLQSALLVPVVGQLLHGAAGRAGTAVASRPAAKPWTASPPGPRARSA